MTTPGDFYVHRILIGTTLRQLVLWVHVVISAEHFLLHRIRKKLREGRVNPKYKQIPAFAYKDFFVKTDDLMEGIFQSELLLQVSKWTSINVDSTLSQKSDRQLPIFSSHLARLRTRPRVRVDVEMQR